MKREMLPRIAFAAATLTLIMQAAAQSVRAEPNDRPIGILLAAGDIAECKPTGPKGQPASGYKQKETADLLGKEIADAKKRGLPIRVLALGDLAYRKGTTQEFDDCFHQSWGTHIDFILPVPGNHEYKSTDAEPYFAYFKKHGRQMVLQNSPTHGPKAGYYSLNFPSAEELIGSEVKPWRLIALNSRNGIPPAKQLDWLKEELKSNNHRCVLAFAHFFAFSSGRHGHEPPDFNTADEANSKKKFVPDRHMGKVLQTLYENGASLLLSGHDHGYEQFKRQDGMGKEDEKNGVRSFVVGTGGATFYNEPYTKTWPNSETPRTPPWNWHGVLKLELFETRYSWRFVPIDKPNKEFPPELGVTSNEDCNTRKSPP